MGGELGEGCVLTAMHNARASESTWKLSRRRVCQLMRNEREGARAHAKVYNFYSKYLMLMGAPSRGLLVAYIKQKRAYVGGLGVDRVS